MVTKTATRVSQSDFEEMADSFMGWCTGCKSFTRDTTEPDAEDYDCPVCGDLTVMGAENALLCGELEFSAEEGE
jgi:hypothetical protein